MSCLSLFLSEGLHLGLGLPGWQREAAQSQSSGDLTTPIPESMPVTSVFPPLSSNIPRAQPGPTCSLPFVFQAMWHAG